MTIKYPITIAPNLAMPLNFVTEKMAWIGVTGSGKSFGAQRSAEQLWAARAPFVALDPKGDWWGLRLAADGKSPGLPIPVFGGLHGDVPLDSTAGALIADLIFDKHISAVVDVSQFDTDTQKARFVTAFLDRLFVRHKRAPTARHIYLEECQEFIPQNPQRGEEQMLHVAHRLQKMGRGFGLGTSLITQRPQEVSKKALNQAQTLFLFRLMGGHERKAIKEWVTDKGLDEALLEGLPSLATGTAHVWSPAWLKVFSTIHISMKATFNASATPEVGAKPVVHNLAAIDIGEIKEAMAATVEKAKADDPAVLRARIAQLERAAKHIPALDHTKKECGKVEEKIVEIPVLKGKDLQRFERGVAALTKIYEQQDKITVRSATAREDIGSLLVALEVSSKAFNKPVPAAQLPLRVISAAERTPAIAADPRRGINIPYQTHALPKVDLAGMPPRQCRIISALTFLEGCGFAPADKTRVAFFAGSAISGRFDTDLAELKRNLWISAEGPGMLRVTEEGRKLADPVSVPQNSAELQASVLFRLPPRQQRILKEAIRVYPEALERSALAGLAGSAVSGRYDTDLGFMKGLGALEYPSKGFVKASSLLFLERA